MINYYELLEISKDASRDNIEAAIRKMRRTWNNRANNPNADIRAEAEQRIRAIAEAERILLDDSARREYDARLASAPVTGSTSGPSGREADDSEDWISLAIEYDERKDYDSLARLMEKVTRMYPNNARAWVWRGLASEATDSVNDAVYEFKKAISLEPNNAVYHAVLGDLYMDHDENRAAEDEYRTAYRLSPNDNEYKLNVAMICGVQEKVFDNPRFSFVSETLKKVGDRFAQIIITKEATAYVVSERILKKTPEQKALIRKYLG